MRVAVSVPDPDIVYAREQRRSVRNAVGLLLSILIHLMLLWLYFSGWLQPGVSGGATGDGGMIVMQIAVGKAQDRYAEPEAVKHMDKLVDIKSDAIPVPDFTVAPSETAIHVELKPAAQSAEGVAGGQGGGAGGDALDTSTSRKGKALSGGDIRGKFTGHVFRLEMGRVDLEGGNRLINTEIDMQADGSTKVALTQYFAQTYHDLYSSTRNQSGSGQWSVEGNHWCHRSKVIQYNTRDCYDVTMDGPTVRLYYAFCSNESSMLCKPGRLAAIGEIR